MPRDRKWRGGLEGVRGLKRETELESNLLYIIENGQDAKTPSTIKMSILFRIVRTSL